MDELRDSDETFSRTTVRSYRTGEATPMPTWVGRSSSSGQSYGAFPPGDVKWKRVAKDRARKKAAKKHKQQMRRQGK